MGGEGVAMGAPPLVDIDEVSGCVAEETGAMSDHSAYSEDFVSAFADDGGEEEERDEDAGGWVTHRFRCCCWLWSIWSCGPAFSEVRVCAS